MAHIAPGALDAAANYIKTRCTGIYVCSREPTSYAEAISFSLGYKAAPTITGPADGATTGGRKITIGVFNQAAGVTATGRGFFYALVNSASGGELLAVQDLIPAKDFIAGSALVLDRPFVIEFPGLD